ncbi:hypothetical protein Cfor_12527, partial [Coptotermes formosanus]
MAVVIETTLGDITVDLFTEERPRRRGVQHISEATETKQDTGGMLTSGSVTFQKMENRRTVDCTENREGENQHHYHTSDKSSRGNESSKDNNNMYKKNRKHEDASRRGYRQEEARNDKDKDVRSGHSHGRSSEVSRSKREE